MSSERFSGEFYAQRVFEFIKLGTQAGINNFSLTEPLRDVPTYFWGFVCLFPQLQIYRQPLYMSFVTDPKRDISNFRGKILSLSLTTRIRGLNVVESTPIRQTTEKAMAALDMPSVILAFGERYNPTEEVISLFCIEGMSPREGLRRIQKRTREVIAARN